jgi:LCP family protein required for cell wall assembly
VSTATSPVRNPDSSDPDGMTRRAWVLVVLNILIPGSAQLLAGSRRLGRFGVGATFILWAVVIIGVLLFLVWPTAIFTLASTSVTLWIIGVVLVFYAVLWVVLTLDTLRLVRLVKALPSARARIAGLATVAMVVFAGGGAYAAYLATTAGSFVGDVFVVAPPEPPVDGRYNIMLLGADAGPDREGLRPDSITVVSIDAETGAATMIGIPRNLEYVPFPESSPLYAKYPNGYGADDGCEVDVCYINSVYTEVELYSPEMYPNAVAEGSNPGIEAMRDAVSGVTGLTIQYYALIEMQGFIDLVDSLGGVTVTVETAVPIHTDETFTEVAEWIGPGVVHLDGYHALWYARSRHDRLRPHGASAPDPAGDPRAVHARERAEQVPGRRGRRGATRGDGCAAVDARILRRPRGQDQRAADHEPRAHARERRGSGVPGLPVHPPARRRRDGTHRNRGVAVP